MKPIGIRTPTQTKAATGSASTASTASTTKAHATTPTPPVPPTTAPSTVTPQAPLTAADVAKQAGTAGVPSWATPAYFTSVAQRAAKQDPTSGKTTFAGGSGLNVRLGALTTKLPGKPATTTPLVADTPDARTRGAGLLQRVGHAFGVIAGRPMTAAEIAAQPKALHLTRPEYVSSIMDSGLRPTVGLYKNLTTWFRDAVYMFSKEPTAYQRFVNFSTAASAATAVIEIDLTKLDPQKLYKRVVDDAVIYVSNEPIPKEALRVRALAGATQGSGGVT